MSEMPGGGHASFLICRGGILAQLRSRNARERGQWSAVFDELRGLRLDLEAAKANQFALQREAVAASVSCPNADLSGLLADTPVAPHMRQQLGAALRSQLAPRTSTGRAPPLDPLLISGCDAVIACLLATSPAQSPSATAAPAARPSSGSTRGSDELSIGDLEACFAGSICTTLVAENKGTRAFGLRRMHRLVAKFRALIADACYGTVLGDDYNATDPAAPLGMQSGHVETPRDDDEETPRNGHDDQGEDTEGQKEVPLTPQEELIFQKARRQVTDKVMELNQRLYSSEILLAEKHQEVVLCYQRMADRAKEFQALHSQLGKLRQEHTSGIKEAQARKRYCAAVDEENIMLKRQVRQQTEAVKALEASQMGMRRDVEQANLRVEGLQDEVKHAAKALAQAENDAQIVAQTLSRDVDCLLSVSCRLQSECLALQKKCAAHEATIDGLHMGRHSAVRKDKGLGERADGSEVSAECRAAAHPLGAGFNDPALAGMSADDGDETAGGCQEARQADQAETAAAVAAADAEKRHSVSTGSESRGEPQCAEGRDACADGPSGGGGGEGVQLNAAAGVGHAHGGGALIGGSASRPDSLEESKLLLALVQSSASEGFVDKAARAGDSNAHTPSAGLWRDDGAGGYVEEAADGYGDGEGGDPTGAAPSCKGGGHAQDAARGGAGGLGGHGALDAGEAPQQAASGKARWGVQVDVGDGATRDAAPSPGASRHESGAAKQGADEEPPTPPSPGGCVGVSAQDFRHIRVAKNSRSHALAAKAVASSSKGSMIPIKHLVKESLLGHVMSPSALSSKPANTPEAQQVRSKRGAKRWDQTEVANLYQHWRDARGLQAFPPSSDAGSITAPALRGSAPLAERRGTRAVESGGEGGEGGAVRLGSGGGAERETALWSGDGVLLGVPDVLDAQLDSEVASLTSQNIQDLLVDTALRVARSRRGMGLGARGGKSGDAADAGKAGGGCDKPRRDLRAMYTASVKSLPSKSPGAEPSSPAARAAAGDEGNEGSRAASADAAMLSPAMLSQVQARPPGLDDPELLHHAARDDAVLAAAARMPPPAAASHGCRADGSALSPSRGAVDRRGTLGLELQEDPKTGCYLVSRVRDGSTAHDSRIEVGDVIVEVDGHQVMPGSTADEDQEPPASLHQLVQLCRGPPGSVARVKLLKGSGRWRMVNVLIPRV